MIGRFETIHPTEGYKVILGYTKINKMIRLTSVTDGQGVDIWSKLSTREIQMMLAKIPNQ